MTDAKMFQIYEKTVALTTFSYFPVVKRLRLVQKSILDTNERPWKTKRLSKD